MADKNLSARSTHKPAPHSLRNDPAHARSTDPRQAVRGALKEEMRSRPTTMWQAFLGRLQARLARAK